MRTPSPSAVVTGAISASSVSAVVSSRRRPFSMTATTGAPSKGAGVPCTGRALGAISLWAWTMSPTRAPIGASKMRPSGNVARTLVRGRPG